MIDALLRLYPRPWRDRYGPELEAMVADGGGLRPMVALDIVRAAARERLRERAVVVLEAWAVFVVAGMAVQKLSEHWQTRVAPSARTVPAWAFDGIVAGAVVGAAAIAVAALLALPALIRRLRLALGLTLAAACATGFVVWWVHGPARSASVSHAIGIVWVLLLVAALASWTSVGVQAARQVDVHPWLVRTVAAAMVEMTVCTAVWWSGAGVGLALAVPVAAMALAAATAGLAVLGNSS